jgi:putative transposon-encoded protein
MLNLYFIDIIYTYFEFKMDETMEVRLKAYQVIEKKATRSGSSAHVFVPKEWRGKKVKVLLLEQITENEKMENEETSKPRAKKF